jgi:outer membrane lipoprotein-sorting protein
MNDHLDKNLEKVHETFSQDHDELREQLMDSLPKRTPTTGWIRLIRTGEKIMTSKITKLAAAAVFIFAIALAVNVFDKTIPTASAAEFLQEAVNAVSDIWSVHMKTQMRTLPGDNFSVIGLEYEFVPIEMWKHVDENGQLRWRVEKPGRVLLMDGQNTTMLIRPNHGVLRKMPLPLGCYDSWSGRLLNVQDLLDSELQRAKNNPDYEAFMWHKDIEGRDKLILEIEVRTDVEKDDYLRNKYITDSDHLKIYCFDSETKLLEGLQVYVHGENEDVLIFEVTDIEYNTEIAESVFTLDLPENMNWSRKAQILPDNERYANMTPKETAEAFFGACAEENWEEVLKFWTSSRIDERIKAYIGGLEIISIGEPFRSKGYTRSGWFVPYEIRLKSGRVQKHNLAIRNDNPAKRFVIDGGL